MKRKKIIVLSLLVVLSIFIYSFILLPANSEVNLKLGLIKTEVNKMGYNPKFFVISGKRSESYNKILSNSAKKSYHLKGMAIDIYVIDIDGDFDFDKDDIKILKKANKLVESKNPNLKGGFGTYTNKGYLTSHMVHIDTRGYSYYYNY